MPQAEIDQRIDKMLDKLTKEQMAKLMKLMGQEKKRRKGRKSKTARPSV